MKRRTFLAGLFAGIAAALVPATSRRTERYEGITFGRYDGVRFIVSKDLPPVELTEGQVVQIQENQRQHNRLLQKMVDEGSIEPRPPVEAWFTPIERWAK